MIRSNRIVFVILACTLSAGLASAGVGVSANLGTLGYGGDITVGLIPQLNVRAGINMLNITLNDSFAEETGVPTEVTSKIDFQTIPLLVDWHPWASAFRFSAGIMLNNNEVSLSAKPGDTVTFNHTKYAISSVDGRATFEKTAPYVGIGTGNAADRSSHWHFACDIGVLFQGDPKISLSAVAADPSLQTLLDADVQEEQKKIQDDAKIFNFYPLVAVGVSYTF